MSKIQKQWRDFIIAIVLPFIVVWSFWVLTAGTFSAIKAFESTGFWVMSVIWWFLVLCLCQLFFPDDN